MWLRIIAVCLLALVLTPFAGAQTGDRSRIAVAQALYAANATSAAEARAADDRIRSLRQEVDRQRARGAGAEAELAAAQERFVAALAERDRAYAQQIAIFRGAVEDIVATPEGRAALEQFNAGNRALALSELDRLQAESERMRAERANIENAAGRRRVANIAFNAIGDGVTTAEVIERFEAVVAIDPNVSADWTTLADLYHAANRVSDATRASRIAVERATSDAQRTSALRRLAENLQRSNDPGASDAYLQLLTLDRAAFEADQNNVRNRLYYAQTLIDVASYVARAGQTGAAEQLFLQAQVLLLAAPQEPSLMDWATNLRVNISVSHAGIYNYNQDYARQAEQGAAAMALAEAALARRPESQFLRGERARAAMYRGYGESGLGRHADAARSFAVAVEWQRQRATADPTRTRSQHELFSRLNSLARAQIAANDRSAAQATLEEAVGILERTPFERSDIQGLESSASLLASYAGFLGDSAAGVQRMKQALLIAADLLARFPTGPRYFTNMISYANTAANNTQLQSALTETAASLSDARDITDADWRYPRAVIAAARCTAASVAESWQTAAAFCPEAVAAARALASQDQVSRMILAESLVALGRFSASRPDADRAAARAAFEEALTYYPNSMAYWRLARLSSAENNFADAQRYMRSYLQQIPSDFSARSDLCWYGIRERSSVAAALRECDASLNGQPNNPRTLANRGIGRLLVRDYAGAESDFTATLTHGPGASRFYGRYLARMSLGREQEARADLAEAERLDPNIRATFESYGLSAPQ